MKKIGNLFDVRRMGAVMGTLLLGVGLASCETERPCNPSNKIEGGDTTKGIEVFLEVEDENGNVRAVTGDNDYSFGVYDPNSNATVQVGGTGLIPTKQGSNKVDVSLTFYAQENVVFQGWSWRYAEDLKGTHLDQKGNKIGDYISTPALQAVNGLKGLAISKEDRSFTCTYNPNNQNKVYVKVKYVKAINSLPIMPYVDLRLFDQSPLYGTGLFSLEEPTYKRQIKLADFLLELIDAGTHGPHCSLFHGSYSPYGSYAYPEGVQGFLYTFIQKMNDIGTKLIELENDYRDFLLNYKPRTPYFDYNGEVDSTIKNNFSILKKDVERFVNSSNLWLGMAISNLNRAGGVSIRVGTKFYQSGDLVNLMGAYQASISGMPYRIEKLLSGQYSLYDDSNSAEYRP